MMVIMWVTAHTWLNKMAVPKHLHTAGTVSEARNAKLLGLTSVTNLGNQSLDNKEH